MTRHLVLVTHYFSSHLGGVEKVAAELASRMVKSHGWTIEWIASDTDPLPAGLPDSMVLEPVKAWNGLETKLGVPWPVWTPGALRKLWIAIGRADVVHIHDAIYFGNAFAWLFARLRGVPVMVTQHTGSIPFRSAILRAIHTIANHTLGRLVLSKAYQTVFISPAVREEYERFCRFRAAPIYYPNGVDTAVFSPAGEIAADPAIERARREGGRVLLFVGRFLEKKGLNILRELATAFPDDLWIFAGWGPLDPERWGLHNVLVVRGETGAGLASYYRAADLLLLSSYSEGFPLVVQEAMACGTPVMVDETSAAGCPDARPLMFVEKVGGTDTAARWTRRLSELLEDPHRLQALRSEVAKFAREHWSWEGTAAEYARLLDAIVLCKSAK